jgi:predicted nucleotidyltransferase
MSKIPITSIPRFLNPSVFGSILRDDFSPGSDIDVLVGFQPGAQVGLLALSRMQWELFELLQRPVDLVPRNGL